MALRLGRPPSLRSISAFLLGSSVKVFRDACKESGMRSSREQLYGYGSREQRHRYFGSRVARMVTAHPKRNHTDISPRAPILIFSGHGQGEPPALIQWATMWICFTEAATRIFRAMVGQREPRIQTQLYRFFPRGISTDISGSRAGRAANTHPEGSCTYAFLGNIHADISRFG